MSQTNDLCGEYRDMGQRPVTVTATDEQDVFLMTAAHHPPWRTSLEDLRYLIQVGAITPVDTEEQPT